MFTGIIDEIGVIEKIEWSREPAVVTVRALGVKVIDGLKKGDSVSVNGVCLTVVGMGKGSFSVEAIRETLKKTNLGESRGGRKVNLEGALIHGGKISGHFVTGHIDGAGTVKARKEEKGEIFLEIKAPDSVIDGIVPKGSVAVDGASLTVTDVKSDSFSVYIIPHTAKVTTLGSKNAGDKVNLETDILGKYVKKFLENKPSNITERFLKDKGFI